MKHRSFIQFSATYLLLMVTSTPTLANSLAHIRSQFMCIQTEQHIQSLIEQTSGSADPNLIAYHGACQTMLAQYAGSPWKKYYYFKHGTELLDQSVRQINTIDNRYLRLVIQINAPSFLNYHAHVSEDCTFLIQNLPSSVIPIPTKNAMIHSILDSKSESINARQISGLKALLQPDTYTTQH